MAQDKPTQLPEWASDPPVAPPTTITEPSSPTKAAGWQPGNPRREYMNWWMNLAWQCFVWLFQISDRIINLVFPDQPINEGTAPVTGFTLVSNASVFSARVIADGYAIGPISSQAYTYTASRDTYWDLRRDGTWIPAVVTNGAGAPAVAANATRVYKVVTNATDRTGVTDYRLTYQRIDKVFDFGQVRFGEYLRGSLSNLNLARLYIKYKGGAGTGYTSILDLENDSGDMLATRIYMRHAFQDLVAVRGAKYKASDNTWDFDAGATSATMETLGYHKEFHELNSLIVTANFANSVWYSAATASNGVLKRWDITSQVRAGTDLASGDYQKSELFRFIAKVYGGGHREAIFDGSSIKFYALPDASQGTDGYAGRGGEIAINCVWNDATDQWDKTDTAASAMKIDLTGDLGLRVLIHLSGDSWDDDFAGGNWTSAFSVDVGASGVSMLGTLTAPQAPQALHAGGVVLTDASGGFVYQQCFGCTPSIVGGVLRLTLDHAMISTHYLWPVASCADSFFLKQYALTAGVAEVAVFDQDGTTPIDLAATSCLINFHIGGIEA